LPADDRGLWLGATQEAGNVTGQATA
jgi:hypothetical protein